MKILIFFLIPIFSFSQSEKILNHLDSSYVARNDIIESYSDSSYFNSGLGEVLIDPHNLDQELLNAAIFFAINQARELKSRPVLNYDRRLEFVAYNFSKHYSKNKFLKPKRSRRKFEKVLFRWSQNVSSEQKLLSTNVCYLSLLNTPSRTRLRKEKNALGDMQWYYFDKDKNKVFIPFFTYNGFAQKVLKTMTVGSNNRFFYSKSFETMACFAMMDKSNANSSFGPMVKVIQIVGGRRFEMN